MGDAGLTTVEKNSIKISVSGKRHHDIESLYEKAEELYNANPIEGLYKIGENLSYSHKEKRIVYSLQKENFDTAETPTKTRPPGTVTVSPTPTKTTYTVADSVDVVEITPTVTMTPTMSPPIPFIPSEPDPPPATKTLFNDPTDGPPGANPWVTPTPTLTKTA